MDTFDWDRIAPALDHLALVVHSSQESQLAVGRAAAEAMAAHLDLAPALSGVTAAMERMIQESNLAPVLAAQSAALLQVADVTAAITDAIDLSWLPEYLSRVADAVPMDWFEEQVRTLYSSGLLDNLDEESLTREVEEVPADTAAALEAAAVAFQERVPFLPFADQRKLFAAFMCAIAVSVLAVVAVSVQDDGKAKDVLGSVSDIAGITGTVVPLSVLAWDRRARRHQDDDDEGAPPSP